MKQLGTIAAILILMGVGSAGAELTASQHVPSPAAVGETVMVNVMLFYNGANSTQAIVTPVLPPGVISESGGQTTEMYPGSSNVISYPIRAERSGSYWIVSSIAYAEDSTWRRLQLESPFTAIGETPSEPAPAPEGDRPMPGAQDPPGALPDNRPEQPSMPGNATPQPVGPAP
ncbi:MAG: hypothetical protein QUS08_07585 [Methanothrix sp.]|nr:hypothetical protein [Methanothrix sp.]